MSIPVLRRKSDEESEADTSEEVDTSGNDEKKEPAVIMKLFGTAVAGYAILASRVQLSDLFNDIRSAVPDLNVRILLGIGGAMPILYVAHKEVHEIGKFVDKVAKGTAKELKELDAEATGFVKALRNGFRNSLKRDKKQGNLQMTLPTE